MTTEASRIERMTWLRVEFEQIFERYLHGSLDARELATAASGLSSQPEVDHLADELLQHSFWAMQHMQHRPACWAPTREEIEYLLLCLRDEESFDPDQVEFTLNQAHGS
jgi:hypothetical protein